MPRLRTLKPGFFENELLADLGPHAMLLFAGLWCWADREGRLEDRPRRIRADIFPYWPRVRADLELQRLDNQGFIVRYSVGDDKYIQITNFRKHQTPHIKERASTIPAPDSPGASTVPRTHPAPPVFGYLSLGSGGHSVSEADTTCLSSPSGDGITKSTSVRKAKDNGIPEDFHPFWALYPRHIRKAAAVKAWVKLSVGDRTAAVAALPKHLSDWRSKGTEKSYIPHASSWLNGRRWEDELDAAPGGPTDAEREREREERRRESAAYEERAQQLDREEAARRAALAAAGGGDGARGSPSVRGTLRSLGAVRGQAGER